jgi:hypothetical protein
MLKTENYVLDPRIKFFIVRIENGTATFCYEILQQAYSLVTKTAHCELKYILYSLPLIESTDMTGNNTDVRAYMSQN